MACIAGSCTASATIAVLDDFDPDYTTPPFEDRLTLLNFYPYPQATSHGTVQVKSGFNTTQAIGDWRQLVATPDGTRIVTVELAANALSVFDRDLKPTIPAITGIPFAGVYATNDYIYATAGTTTSGDSLRAYDLATGAELQGSPSTTLRGLDVVVDSARNVVWTVGNELRRGNASTLVGESIATYAWSAVSIDLAPDGSVWVAERDYSTETGNIHRYNAAGSLITSMPWSSSPFCVRVNQATGEVWVAHSNGISRIDSEGRILAVETSGSYWSLTVDPFQGLVWATSNTVDSVKAYRSDGTLLDTATGFSTSQKYVALVAGTLPSGLVARLSFGGNPNDSSGHGFVGVVSGSPVYTTDRHGLAAQALQFDGRSKVTLPVDAAFSLSSFTLYAVFKTPTPMYQYALISKGTSTGYGNYFLGLDPQSGRGQYFQDIPGGGYGSLTTNVTLATDTFVHHAVTVEGSSLLGYVNGALVTSFGNAPVRLMNDFPVIIGGHPTFERSFSGVIDEVLIFNHALSPAEMKQLYDRLK